MFRNISVTHSKFSKRKKIKNVGFWPRASKRQLFGYPWRFPKGHSKFQSVDIYLSNFSNPKKGHQTNRTVQFSDIILRILRFLAESSGVTKLELFQPFAHCKWGFSRCTDSARLRQDSAAKDIKTCTKLW